KLILVATVMSYIGSIIYVYGGQAVETILTSIFFPRDMVLYVSLAVPLYWLYFWMRRKQNLQIAPIVLLFTFSALLAFRILMRMLTQEYPIFYNGPVVLSFLLLLNLLISRAQFSRRLARLTQVAVCLGCLAAVALPTISIEAKARGYAPLVTDRGTMRVPEILVPRYQTAINFMK